MQKEVLVNATTLHEYNYAKVNSSTRQPINRKYTEIHSQPHYVYSLEGVCCSSSGFVHVDS